MKTYQGIRLSQMERRVDSLAKFKTHSKTKVGWIRLIRSVVGLSAAKLAEKMGVTRSSLSDLERREVTKQITLKKLEEVAHALDCDLVYAFVPRTRFTKKIEDQALRKAKEILGRADTHMELEDQRVKTSYQERLNSLKERLIKSGDIW